MKRKNKNKKLTLILVLILLISVGYAALASNLKINGSSTVNVAEWDVYWDNIQITEGSVSADDDHKARITDSNKTQVEFSVRLDNPGDYYEFTVDAVNNGTIDAMIAANGIVDGVYTDSTYDTQAEIPKALGYTVTYADGKPIQEKHLLAKKSGNTPTIETYKVRIEYRNDEEINPSDLDKNNNRIYYFKFSVNYVQADNTAKESHPGIYYAVRQNEGQITPGDVIKIGDTENFYVISSNSEKTVLLAKYNLLVGNVAELDEQGPRVTGTISPLEEGYGLQSADAGLTLEKVNEIRSAGGTWKGTVAFSSTNYWDGENGLLSPYNANGASYDGNPFPYVYDSSLTTSPDFENDGWNTSGYSIAHYVEQYVTALKGMGAPSTITGRLLTFEEVTSPSIGCDANENTCPQESFITDTTFWLGSACSITFVGVVLSDGNFTGSDYSDSFIFGVRPVIEIPTSELE